MKKSILIRPSATLVTIVGMAAFGGAADEAKPAKLRVAGKAFIEAVVRGDYAAATKNFDDTMRKALPADKLQELWKTLNNKLGKFKAHGNIRVEKSGKYDVVLVTCQFEKLALDGRIVFDEKERITGLFFVPAATGEYKPPEYVQRDSFQEMEVKFGALEWELPGTLSVPKGDGRFPAVVLVHGSGPNDRDETIVGNRPFRDLAWGLASRKVAVLRYDKRTRVHGAKMAAKKIYPTVKEEVTDDALAALAFLRKTKEIDGRRVFVLGHSLGAILAPQLAELDPQIAGLIIMAGATRPLEDLVLEQFTYLYSLEGKPTDEQRAELEKIKKQIAKVKDPNLSRDTPASELPLGAPAAYWLSLRDAKPVERATKLSTPMLVLQGERDYQVTMEDFAGWKKALAGRKTATLKSYPKLNHLFMGGLGKAKPDEYMKTNHVAKEVIDDIAAWIEKP